MKSSPVNGHVDFVLCQDPANMTVGKLLLANLGKRGIVIGKVTAVDETPIYDAAGNIRVRPHICKPGDVIYVRDPEIAGSFKLDGGTDAYSIRESFIMRVVTDVEASVLTSEQIADLTRQRKEEDARAAQEAQMRKGAAIARDIGLLQG